MVFRDLCDTLLQTHRISDFSPISRHGNTIKGQRHQKCVRNSPNGGFLRHKLGNDKYCRILLSHRWCHFFKSAHKKRELDPRQGTNGVYSRWGSVWPCFPWCESCGSLEDFGTFGTPSFAVILGEKIVKNIIILCHGTLQPGCPARTEALKNLKHCPSLSWNLTYFLRLSLLTHSSCYTVSFKKFRDRKRMTETEQH